MKTPALPPSGALIRLTRTPRASWATAGEVYRVTYGPSQRAGLRGIWPSTSVRLWNEARDCGTYDAAMNWDTAQWEPVKNEGRAQCAS